MTTHCYHTTATDHKIHLTIEGDSGPVLISIHGGGIINASRRDEHLPAPIKSVSTRLLKSHAHTEREAAAWSGTIIAVDYRLLHPSTGHDILEDMAALLAFLPTLPIAHDQLFFSGFSGGGYPLRLAAVLAAQEAQRPAPRFALRGWVSYFGMTGDMLLDYWLFPRGTSHRALDTSDIPAEQETLRAAVAHWLAPGAEEISDCPYMEGLEGRRADRGPLWEYWHATGTINDAISGEPGLSARLATLSYAERLAAIPAAHHAVFPQVYFADPKNAAHVPPLLLIHGDADDYVPYEESVTTLEALRAGRGRVELVTVPGADHGLQVEGELSQAAMDALAYAVEWMLSKLKLDALFYTHVNAYIYDRHPSLVACICQTTTV
jgi:acetyl esterase/lipase